MIKAEDKSLYLVAGFSLFLRASIIERGFPKMISERDLSVI